MHILIAWSSNVLHHSDLFYKAWWPTQLFPQHMINKTWFSHLLSTLYLSDVSPFLISWWVASLAFIFPTKTAWNGMKIIDSFWNSKVNNGLFYSIHGWVDENIGLVTLVIRWLWDQFVGWLGKKKINKQHILWFSGRDKWYFQNKLVRKNELMWD